MGMGDNMRKVMNPVFGFRRSMNTEADGNPSADSDKSSKNAAPSVSGNHIYFYDDVNPGSIMDLNRGLWEGHINMRRALAEWGGDLSSQSPPLHLHIHSYGGDVFSGFAAGDVIASLPTPVHTHIEGGAASAATLLSLSGHYRTMSKNSFILIHEISSGFWGKQSELEDHKESMDRMSKVLIDFYVEKTKLTENKLKEMLKHDIWFTPKEALEFGLVDVIV